MTSLIFVALIGWLPFSLLLFVVAPPRRAVIITLIGGWIVLPPAGIPLPGLPDYDKLMAPVAGVILGTLIFHPNRLLAFRPRWFDIPAFLWCLCPLFSSLANGLGFYDGMSGTVGNAVHWTIPYLIGRMYFGDKEAMHELAAGIAIGGMALIVPCLFEMRMSPILLDKVYGIGRYEGFRLGGYRPRIFFTTGLELGMWMTASSLAATWLWWTGSLRRSQFYSLFAGTLPFLLITTVFCRASGALVLLIVGLTVLWACTRFKSNLLLCVLLLVPLLYYFIRIPNLWSGTELTAFISTYFNKERGGSLEFRFEKENLLAKRAMLRPVWGWGGWGRNRVKDERTGRDIAPTDGIWIIFLGTYGLVGLSAWTTMMALSAWFFALRVPAHLWRDPEISPLAVIATFIGIYLVDCLLNGFMNLSYIVATGGLLSAVQSSRTIRQGKRPTSPRQKSAIAPGTHEDQTRQSARPTTGRVIAQTPAPTPQERLAARYKDLSRTLRSQGQAAEAKSMLAHALQLLNSLAKVQPDTPGIEEQRRECANDLAWLIISQPDPSKSDLDTAADLARQTATADTKNAAYWNTLGAALFCIGEHANAITALEQSLALAEKGTGYDYVFLALAHQQLGQGEQARHWLQRADGWLEAIGPCPPTLLSFFEQAHDQVQRDPNPLVT